LAAPWAARLHVAVTPENRAAPPVSAVHRRACPALQCPYRGLLAMWDANQYLKFADERARPYFDLLAQVRPERVRTIVDLGWGPGRLTRTLAERWPEAVVTGVDNSAEMLAQAQPLTMPGRLSFVQGDITTWQPEGAVDLLVSNAALQWVPSHAT